MKLVGALLIIVSCFSCGVYYIVIEKSKLKTVFELMSLLKIMKDEICVNYSPMKDVIIKVFNRACMTKPFFGEILSNIDRLGDISFYEIWSDAVNNELTALNSEIKDCILVLGNNLGKYDSLSQSEAIVTCLNVLKSTYIEEKAGSTGRIKVSIGICISVGAIILIFLI